MTKQIYKSPVIEMVNFTVLDVLTMSEGADFDVTDLFGEGGAF